MTRQFYDDEVVRCPWCGARAYFDDIDQPSDYCHHEEIHEHPAPPRTAVADCSATPSPAAEAAEPSVGGGRTPA